MLPADVRLGMLVKIADADRMPGRFAQSGTNVDFTDRMHRLCGMTGVVTAQDTRPIGMPDCFVIGDLNSLFIDDKPNVKASGGWYLHAYMFDDVTPKLDLVSYHRLTLCEQLENADPSQYIGILNRS